MRVDSVTNALTYVKHVIIKYEKFSSVDSIINDLILKETSTGADFKTINSSIDGGSALFVLVFERTTP
jgi:hypothetical protein